MKPFSCALKQSCTLDSAVINWIGILGSRDTPRCQGVVFLPGRAAWWWGLQ